MSGKTARKERGVALLVVLILLVMMSALAAKISQQFCRHLQKNALPGQPADAALGHCPSTEGTGKRVAESGQFRRGGAVAAR